MKEHSPAPQVEMATAGQIQEAAQELRRGDKGFEDLILAVRCGVLRLEPFLVRQRAQGPLPELSCSPSELVRNHVILPQYADQLQRQAARGFLQPNQEGWGGDEPPPSLGEILGSFADRKREVAANRLQIASYFQRPLLLLKPLVRQALVERERERGRNTVIDGWQAFIVDGAPEIQPYEGDEPDRDLAERLSRREKARMPQERGMGKDLYELLAMKFREDGERNFDKGIVTLLDENWEPPGAQVPYAANGNNDETRYGFFEAADSDDWARFRSVVAGDPIHPGNRGF